ncbi:MAG: ATP-binding protein [Planctomycetota bacterium]|nr:ATP-binding protein [Planctomycetota bacterium]
MNAVIEQTTGGAIGHDDLAELLLAVNSATSRLEASHAQLQAQVAKLTSDLGHAQEQLERSRRLAALGEMAAGIAHEIRNPLGCIRLYASMIREDLSDRAPEQAGLAEKITGATRVMEAIVTDVLSFAREFRLRPTLLDPRDLLDRSLDSCSHDGVPLWRGIEVVREYEDGADRLVADDALVRQALVNIIRNALESMAETGQSSHRLTLRVSRRVVADASGSARPSVVLGVSDTGTGVTDEVVARMFNPFFTTRGAGTGLGLAIVHRIIDAHGGRVVVTNNAASARGAGALIEVVLPQDGELSGCVTRTQEHEA